MPAPTADSTARRRIAGVTIPLFSLRGPRSWGIGEINDLPEFADWIRAIGARLVQILPLGEISGGETSPYSALTAFGIDPLYISFADVPDLAAGDLREAVGGEAGLATLERARGADRVVYDDVRSLKSRAARFAYNRFRDTERAKGTARSQAFDAFVQQHRHWLEDYALFRALKDAHEGRAWWDWEAGARERKPEALGHWRDKLADEVQYFQYLQWLAHSQWEDVRARLHERGVEVMGDLPFMVGRDSADVWANQGEFRHDFSVGAPPDQFDEDGQDWGLPPYRWEAMRANDFAWLRRRARYAASLYDRFRIDHLVGFYRTFTRPVVPEGEGTGKMPKGSFDPAEERAQLTHGERVITAMQDAARERGATLIAEDLGAVPPWVRKSLAALGVPGYKVLIWEKDDDVFRDPKTYAENSVACFGTHDTDPVAVWWEGRDEKEREALLALPGLRERMGADAVETKELTPRVHRALLDLISGAGSELVLLLIQDVLGTRERINTPSTMGPQNWSYRLPGTIAQMAHDPEITSATNAVRESLARSGRA